MRRNAFWKRFIVLLVALSLCLSFAGCGQEDTGTENGDTENNGTENSSSDENGGNTAESGDPIYIAILAPFTGDYAQYGEWIYHGITLKTDEINEQGGINGRQIVVERFDDRNDTEEAANLADQICAEEKYLCVIGNGTSGCSLTTAPIFNQYGLVQFCPFPNHMDITGGTTWGMNVDVYTEYRNWADIAMNDLGAQKIALIHLNSDNGEQVREQVTETVTEAGGEMVAVESYITGQVRDFTTILTNIKAAEPDTIMMTANYADVSALLIQAEQFGFPEDTKWLFGNECSVDDFLSAAGDAAEGCYVMTTWAADASETNRSVADAYAEKWDGEAATAYSMQPYEAMNIVIDALESGATDSAGLQEYLLSMPSEYEGEVVSGYWNELQRLQRDSFPYYIVENGEFVLQTRE